MTWLNRNGVPVKLQWHADSLWRTYITWFLCAYPGSEKYDSGVACFDSCNHANTSSLAFQIRILHETAVPVYFQNAVLMLREFIHIRIRSQCSSPWLYRVYSIPGHWGQIYQINMIGWCEIKCLRIHLFSSNFKKKRSCSQGVIHDIEYALAEMIPTVKQFALSNMNRSIVQQQIQQLKQMLVTEKPHSHNSCLPRNRLTIHPPTMLSLLLNKVIPEQKLSIHHWFQL